MAYPLDPAAAGLTPGSARAYRDFGTRADLEAALLRLERRLLLAGLAGLGILFAALRFPG